MKKHVYLIILSIAISVFHYITPTALHHFHAVYQRLYYIPIILASYFFGLKLGLAYALFCGLLYMPHIFFQWSFDPHQSFTQYVEITMFFVISALVGFLSEIQEKQRKQIIKQKEDLYRADRLNLLGKLAAGLAHEIRNPLGSLLGSVEILRKELGSGHPKAEFVVIMEKELNRLNGKLNEFLSFARSRPLELVPNNINDIINSTVSIIQSELTKRNIALEKELKTGVPMVPMDSEQIKQVMLNLFLNSMDALPYGGKISIRTQCPENFLLITVEDEGKGIKSGNMDKIFDPFFTTKKNGTGLGLSIARQIIEKHNGTIEPLPKHQGAIFQIRIPHEKP
jgi:signal transduction histidine kinase